MSDNKNNTNNNPRGKGKPKDTFAVPGDESIVSGKSFFLSFGKQKKGSANPLLASEKNKSENRSAENTVKKNDTDKSGGRNGRDGKKRFDNQKNNRQDKNRAAQVKENGTAPVNAENKNNAEKNPASGNGQNLRRNDRNRKGRNKNDRRDRNRDAGNVKPQNTEPQQENGKAQVKTAESIQKTGHNENAGGDRSLFVKQRQKHKKEKFVPSAPAADTEEVLLQPIVDRTGIIGGARSGIRRASKAGLGMQQSSFSNSIAADGDEPRYIDRNRPLAEQIAEQSKPKTYARELSASEDTVEVIGVRFREAGKVYYFDPAGKKAEKGTAVIVETARGVEYGFCAIGNRYVSKEDIVAPLKSIIRIATTEDTERYNSNKQLEESAAKVFREKVKQLGLEMSLVYVEYTFDNGKLLFYFTADGRVDFRELIKELAASFRTRIELRQIGVRDEAKIVGGLGICGRPVCCKSFLGEFSQVSIKMAKDQNLFINSSKISGTCGRFMCCIRYEDEVYQKEYERTPKIDAIVETPEGKGVVVESNALKGVVKVLLDDKPDAVAAPFKCTDVKVLGYVKRENDNDLPDGVEIPEE